MAVAVAEMPGKAHLNPLFIYGKSGLGKTHLMRAIQNYINETMPQLSTIYVDSAELLSDYMEPARRTTSRNPATRTSRRATRKPTCCSSTTSSTCRARSRRSTSCSRYSTS